MVAKKHFQKMKKLIRKIYEIYYHGHNHPCIKELIKIIESNWFLKLFK